MEQTCLTTIFLYLISCIGTNIDDTSVQPDTGEDTAQSNIEQKQMYFPDNNDSEWETVDPMDVFPAWDEDVEKTLLHFRGTTKSFMILHSNTSFPSIILTVMTKILGGDGKVQEKHSLLQWLASHSKKDSLISMNRFRLISGRLDLRFHKDADYHPTSADHDVWLRR